MTGQTSVRLVAAALVMLCTTGSLHAAIPPAVEAMIQEAARNGDSGTVETVVRVAKATNPDVADEIAALGAALIAENEAQTQTEKEEKIAAQGYFDGWKGQGEAGFGLTSGNTDELSGVLGLSLAREGVKTRHKFLAAANYQRTNGATSREKYTASYGIDHFLRDGLYVYGLIGWEQDRFAGYARRFTQSAGVGYRALKTGSMTLDLDAGPALRQTRYTDGVNDDDIAVRASLAHRWNINAGMQFSEDASVLSGGGNTTWISTTALTSTLSKALSMRLSFNVQSETSPPAGRKSTDTATRATIVYDF